MSITEFTADSVIDDILDNLPKSLKDDETGEYAHGQRVWLNAHCQIYVEEAFSGSLKVKLWLKGTIGDMNSKTTYKVNDKGNISPNFLKRVTAHTVTHQGWAKTREAKTRQRKEDTKKLYDYINPLSELDGLDVDSWDLRNLKDGDSDGITFRSKDYSFKLSLETNCNGEVVLSSLDVGSRSIDMSTIKKLMSILGLTTYDPAPIERSLKKSGELFDTSAFD
jgi:hypothetical protein